VSRRALHSPLTWLSGLLALYLAIPVGAFVVRLATTHDNGFAAPGLFAALGVSVLTATISVAVIALLGTPFAWLLSRSHGRLAAVLGIVAQLPLALPPLVSGLLLVYIVGPYTWLGRLSGGRLTESLVGIVLAQTFVAAPFLVTSARAAFSALDPGLVEVAATLGRGPLARFTLVAVPACADALRAGLLLSWLRAFGEYGATVIVAYHPYSLPVFTYLQFSGAGLSPTEAPTALALGAAAFVVALTRLRPRRRRRVGELPPASAPRPVPLAPLGVDLALDLGDFRLALAHAATSPHLAILGPSGSGKSVTLRCAAGLYGAAPGRVHYGDRLVSDVPVERRRVGYVPQSLALLPHLTVWRQLTFAVGADEGLAAHWLSRLRLDGLADRFPRELSGGQRQRVCLAQALCGSPEILLLDEPFSALDAPLREELRLELRQLQRETGLSTVLVTHDPEEAAVLADEIVVIAAGRLLQAGTRREVFGAPASPEVARLLGIANIMRGTMRADGALLAGGTVLRGPRTRPGPAPGFGVLWCIRPERVVLSPRGGLPAVVVDTVDRGVTMDLVLSVADGLELRARTDHDTGLAPGDRCAVELPAEAITVWEAPT